MSISVNKAKMLQAKNDGQVSLADLRLTYEQWRQAVSSNPDGLTKKELEQLTKGFKNRLLALKWDCEDLEELTNMSAKHPTPGDDPKATEDCRRFAQECRNEVTNLMDTLEKHSESNKVYRQHGINLPNSTLQTAVTSLVQNPTSQYERLNELDGGEIHFDKNQIVTSTAIFNNTLYEHYENDDGLTKSMLATEVFNNLTRPNTDVYMGTNENEMILEMLEHENDSPPEGANQKLNPNGTMAKVMDSDRNKLVKNLLLVLSFPLLLVIFLIF